MRFLLDNMTQNYADYRTMLKLHLGSVMRAELKTLVDSRVSDAGLGGDVDQKQLHEPISKIE